MMGWISDLFSSKWNREPTREEIQDLAAAAPVEVMLLLREGKKIEAIKTYRQATGQNLRRSVAVVNWLESSRM